MRKSKLSPDNLQRKILNGESILREIIEKRTSKGKYWLVTFKVLLMSGVNNLSNPGWHHEN